MVHSDQQECYLEMNKKTMLALYIDVQDQLVPPEIKSQCKYFMVAPTGRSQSRPTQGANSDRRANRAQPTQGQRCPTPKWGNPSAPNMK